MAFVQDKFIAEINEPVVVFLVGGHSTNLLAVRHWFWIARTFIAMLRCLSGHPHAGYLGGHTLFRLFTFSVVLQSYWRSVDDLERFAHAKDEPHLQPWSQCVERVATNAALSIWHETYLIEPGKHEGVPRGMFPFGLAATQSDPRSVEPLIPF